jgi:hypothetical protein
MTDDDELHRELDDYQRLEEAEAALDALPPEVVREAILKNGALDVALTAMVEIAKGDDIDAADKARTYLESRGLGFLLSDEADVFPPDE